MSNVTTRRDRTGAVPAPEVLRKAVNERLAHESDIAVSRDLGLSKYTLLKIAMGRPVLGVTISAAAARMGVDLGEGRCA